MSYNYAILKESYSGLKNVSTFLDNKFKPKSKYALIEKQVFKDGSEGVNRIIYSNDLIKLTEILLTYKSWYNYPIMRSKSLQGYVSDLY